MTELKPCPFCGGSVEIDDPDAYKRKVGYSIQCIPCYLQMWAFAGESPASLTKRWNNRGQFIPGKSVDLEALADDEFVLPEMPHGWRVWKKP